jgi:CHAT domain-containing protein
MNRSGAAAALADASAAIEYFRPARHSLRLVRQILARARIARAAGLVDEAERNLTEGMAEFESQRSAWPNDQVRLASFDEAWSLFDEAVSIAVEQGASRRALEIAERGRARALLDSLDPSRVVRQQSLAEMQAAVPPLTRVLYYRVLPDQTLVWVVSNDSIDMHRVSIAHGEVEARIQRLNAAIQNNTSAARAASRSVYDVLLAPIIASVPPQARLAMIGDGIVQRVPFASLVGHDDRYLIEDHEIVWSPSLSIFAFARRPNGVSDEELSAGALAVAPALAASNGPDALPQLPDALEEAREVGELYDGSELLAGSDATPEAFLREAARHRIVHFAGHSVINQEYPALSKLVLSGQRGGATDGSLFSFQIARQRMDGTRLVVLASCSGAAGKAIRGEGVLSLARPFLAAGVPAVVASLWPLPDRAARPILTAFHRQLKRDDSIAAALRNAQLAKLREGADVREWGGLIAVGRIADLLHNERK